MSDTIEKLLALSPEQVDQLEEERKNFNPDELMTPEEIEKQTAIAEKTLGVNRSLLQGVPRIKTFRKTPEPVDKLTNIELPNYEAKSAINTELLVDKVNELIDTQNRMIEAAEYDRQLAEQRYRDSIKTEKKSFILSVISVAAAAIAALGVLVPFIKYLIGCIA